MRPQGGFSSSTKELTKLASFERLPVSVNGPGHEGLWEWTVWGPGESESSRDLGPGQAPGPHTSRGER